MKSCFLPPALFLNVTKQNVSPFSFSMCSSLGIDTSLPIDLGLDVNKSSEQSM